MKEVPLSNSEKLFISQAIKYQPRLDGRSNDEFRNIKINFGADWGSVLVSLGETKVLAQVSCELGIPKAVRPNEGMLFINIEIGPMAAPHLEAARNTELHVQIIRTLERTFKDSKAVDLESLCVRAEEHVWTLRVDLNVLNHEGNLIDCCSIATLCALAHFRRPDISIEDGGVIIHTAAEKELLPIVLHHYPVCVSFITFNEGKIAVVDPTVNEERTSESQMIFGLNAYRELCCLNLGGTSLTSSKLLLQCANRAAHQAKKIVDQIKEALAVDKAAREKGLNVGFTECLVANKITGLAESRFALCLPNFNLSEATGRTQPMEQDVTPKKEEAAGESPTQGVFSLGAQTAILNSKLSKVRWVPDDEDENEDDENIVNMKSENSTEDDSDNEALNAYDNLLSQLQKSNPKPERKANDDKDDDDDSNSEEENQVIL